MIVRKMRKNAVYEEFPRVEPILWTPGWSSKLELLLKLEQVGDILSNQNNKLHCSSVSLPNRLAILMFLGLNCSLIISFLCMWLFVEVIWQWDNIRGEASEQEISKHYLLQWAHVKNVVCSKVIREGGSSSVLCIDSNSIVKEKKSEKAGKSNPQSSRYEAEAWPFWAMREP